LRDRKTIVEDHEIADTETVPGIGTANRDADIARPVALLHRYAGAFAQHVGHSNRRPVIELAAIDGRLGLTSGRLIEQRARHARGNTRGQRR
jgi:hypothetical protein